jgi:uncharacterized membrane protein YeaQ/YmgE (transglycosylase-associated protein family)
VSNIIWIIMIGFIAGIIARVLSPSPNELGGFIITTGIGIAGAFVATFIGQTIGWYRLDQGAGSWARSSVLSSCCLCGIDLCGIDLSPLALPPRVIAIFISLELRRSTWLITSLSPGGGEKMSKHSVPAEQPTKPAALEIERGRGLTWRQ